MLVLTRTTDDSILIGPDIVVKVIEIWPGKVVLGVHAPIEMQILRDDAKRRERPPKQEGTP